MRLWSDHHTNTFISTQPCQAFRLHAVLSARRTSDVTGSHFLLEGAAGVPAMKIVIRALRTGGDASRLLALTQGKSEPGTKG